jgi:hypothetical protein
MRLFLACFGACTLGVTSLAVATVHAHFVRDLPTSSIVEAADPQDEPPVVTSAAHVVPRAQPARSGASPFGGVPSTEPQLIDTVEPDDIDGLDDCPDPNDIDADRRPDCPLPTEVDEDPPHEIVVDGRKIVVQSSIIIY